jgi:hypothetical protein
VKYNSDANMKIGDTLYDRGIQLGETSGILDFIGSQVDYNFAYFNLNGEYSHLTGQIGLDDKTDNNAGEVIAIFGDAETQDGLQSIHLRPGDLPVDIDFDVSGIRQLAIAVSKNQDRVYVDLINIVLKE